MPNFRIVLKTLYSVLAVALLVTTNVANAFDHQHKKFTQVLSEVVVLSPNKLQSRVDYGQLNKQPDKLNGYLKELSAVTNQQYKSWSSDEQLSFLINAYNGFTLQLINSNYTKFASGKAESIRDLGGFFSSPWKKSFFTLLGEKRSLDDIEHEMIREWFEQPLIHAALVCAAVSCPPLKNTAFVAEKLQPQLEAQMRLFLTDDARNTVNLKKNRVYLSSIFKWYKKDFKKGHQGFNNLKDVIAVYKEGIADNPQQLSWLQKQDFNIRYLDYDWRLNDIANF